MSNTKSPIVTTVHVSHKSSITVTVEEDVDAAPGALWVQK